MDHISKCRCKIWLTLGVFFLCWYFMIHNVKWYNLSSPTTTFRQESNAMEIIDSNTTVQSENTNQGSIKGEIDWLHDFERLRALENELDPLLKEFKPKPKPENKTEDKTEEKRKTIVYRPRKRSCNGRYIYMHDLPAKFNYEILADCRSLNKWQNMCPYIRNNGFGIKLENPQRVFSRSGWYSTNQFLLEVIFHNKMKQYECLTNDSSIASSIYVPYYAGLDVWRYLFDHNISSRDALSLDLAEWLREQPEWKKMSGKNHFLVAGRITWDFRRENEDDDGWGNKLMILPEFKNMTILTIEKSPWHSNDFAIPYPTNFHPKTETDIKMWQFKMRRRRRRTLFSFAGAPRPKMEESIRGEIIKQCIAANQKCGLLQCSNENLKCYQPVDIMRLFQNSVFCLQPPGDSYTRRSTFDSILAGCIPVFFTPGSAYVQYLWHLPKEFGKYSVLINQEDVRRKNVSIERVLSRIPAQKVSQMRNEVIGLIPNVVYGDPKSNLGDFKDAFDLSVDGVLERVRNISRNSSSFDFDERFSWKYYLFGSLEEHEWDHYFRHSMNQKVKQENVEAN